MDPPWFEHKYKLFCLQKLTQIILYIFSLYEVPTSGRSQTQVTLYFFMYQDWRVFDTPAERTPSITPIATAQTALTLHLGDPFQV